MWWLCVCTLVHQHSLVRWMACDSDGLMYINTTEFFLFMFQMLIAFDFFVCLLFPSYKKKLTIWKAFAKIAMKQQIARYYDSMINDQTVYPVSPFSTSSVRFCLCIWRVARLNEWNGVHKWNMISIFFPNCESNLFNSMIKMNDFSMNS